MIEIASKREMCPNKRLYSTQNSKWVENKTVKATSTYSASRCTYYSDLSCLFMLLRWTTFSLRYTMFSPCALCNRMRHSETSATPLSCRRVHNEELDVLWALWPYCSRPLTLKPSFSETLAPYSLFFARRLTLFCMSKNCKNKQKQNHIPKLDSKMQNHKNSSPEKTLKHVRDSSDFMCQVFSAAYFQIFGVGLRCSLVCQRVVGISRRYDGKQLPLMSTVEGDE